jgi:hypothetical protein
VRRLVPGPSIRLPILAPLVLALLAGSARAQPAPVPRPKLNVALGLGASLDRNTPNPKPDRPITSFFFAAGLGDGAIGLDLRSFANGATAMQITRLAVELAAVLRPFEPWQRGRDTYLARVLRAASVDVGPSLERVSRGRYAGRRFGVMLGGHLDFPIGDSGQPRELRLRIGARHLRAGSITIGDDPVSDSTLELYGQLAFVF